MLNTAAAPSNRQAAEALFNAKLPTLEKVITYQLDRRRILRSHLRDDVRQLALLCLWQQCLRSTRPDVEPFVISCDMIFLSALGTWKRQRQADACFRSISDLAGSRDDFDPPEAVSHDPTFKVDGVRLCPADARMDAPEAAAIFEGGITAAEAAERLGVSKQGVMQAAERLGGMVVGGSAKYRRWQFPADLGRP